MENVFCMPTAVDILRGILAVKDSPVINKNTVEEAFPFLQTRYGSVIGMLGSGLIRIIQEEMPYQMFESIDKKELLVKAIGEIVEEAEIIADQS
ncbi:MAG: hypothetical protein ACRCV3_00340 [Desulfovibrionaceae bacterium]